MKRWNRLAVAYVLSIVAVLFLWPRPRMVDFRQAPPRFNPPVMAEVQAIGEVVEAIGVAVAIEEHNTNVVAALVAAAQSPRVVRSRGSCSGSSAEQAIRSAFDGTDAVEWALGKAFAESGCVWDNVNEGSGASGLFQLIDKFGYMEQACPGRDYNEAVLDAECNARAARLLYDAQGRTPWAASGG